LQNIKVNIFNEFLQFDSSGILFWPKQDMLIIADVHFGKAAHFRKSGIAIPTTIHSAELDVMDMLVQKYNPAIILYLGDLFHSQYNSEWEILVSWIKKHSEIKFKLCKGNHDILDESQYEGIEIYKEICVPPFLFTHEPMVHEKYYNVCGHVHPAIRFRFKRSRNITCKCLVVKEHQCILPSFGKFTGNYVISNFKGVKSVYLIVEDSIIDGALLIKQMS